MMWEVGCSHPTYGDNHLEKFQCKERTGVVLPSTFIKTSMMAVSEFEKNQ